jgi:hypothetical protein
MLNLFYSYAICFAHQQSSSRIDDGLPSPHIKDSTHRMPLSNQCQSWRSLSTDTLALDVCKCRKHSGRTTYRSVPRKLPSRQRKIYLQNSLDAGKGVDPGCGIYGEVRCEDNRPQDNQKTEIAKWQDSHLKQPDVFPQGDWKSMDIGMALSSHMIPTCRVSAPQWRLVCALKAS